MSFPLCRLLPYFSLLAHSVLAQISYSARWIVPHLADKHAALLFLICGPCHEDLWFDLSLLSPRLLTFALHYCASYAGLVRF
ncbi:hypothetical protein C8R48DRAFT_701068 [Suillus tomentosus]|nr:hypothetical protein C8R48DRAFT_701068 [Suillus tomentosus]